MDKDNTLVQITPDDISYIEQELARSPKAANLRDLAEMLAFRKTAHQRTQAVKIYDPDRVYQIGDSIYKEYNEPLTVSSKTVETFHGAVVLKVVNKIYYKAFGSEMLEVDYAGGGTFRKYIDYMKKSKTQVLLPSNQGNANLAPPVMGRDHDPRLTELPMTDKDLKSLERNLKIAMTKSPAFFSWNDYWQLTASQPPVPEEKIQEIEARLAASKESAATGDLVKAVIGLEPSNDLYDIHCLGLNHLFETKYKKDFVQVSPLQWGKWHLKTVLNSLPENLPLAAAEASLPDFETGEKVEVTPFHEFPLKVYLSWREICSGGVRIPKAFNKELAPSREYIFTDADDNKNYTVYFFPQNGYFLGLKDFFAANNIPQGTSMTLERKGPVQFHFWLKKSKKKLSVARLTYDLNSEMFADAGEAATLALPNKIIYLEREILAKLLALYPQREGLNLKDLLVLIFKNFSIASTNHSLHYLRAYHLIDILRKTSQEDVELTLLNSPEFSKSDKKKGLYFYQAAAPVKEEPAAAAPVELEAEEAGLEEIPIQEVPEEFEAEAEIEAPVVVEKAKPEPAPAAKKEKPHKKKKGIGEGEKAPRARKSERRVIEERIAEEESGKEALFAEKAVEVDELEAEEAPSQAPLETGGAAPAAEAKPAPSPGLTFGNLFAEKLKSALTKKRKKDAEKKPE